MTDDVWGFSTWLLDLMLVGRNLVIPRRGTSSLPVKGDSKQRKGGESDTGKNL